MGLLSPAKPEIAFLKMGLLGFAGSGKTYTASRIATGMWHYLKTKKPVAMLDTEHGSDWLLPHFDKEKVPFERSKSRSFQDLISIVDEAEKRCSILIIDSITHVWNEFIRSYLQGKNRQALRFHDYNVLKPIWEQAFTTRYINSKLHIILCGRAGWEYETHEDEDTGYEVHKAGVKMKAESELGFEPHLLVHMQRVQVLDGSKVTGMDHHALVLKDRSTVLDGKRLVNPTFKDFAPHIEWINLGGDHKAVELDRKTDPAIFKTTSSEPNYSEQIKIVLEEIEAEIKLMYPGRSDADQKAKIEMLDTIFSTKSWTAVQNLSLDKLKDGLTKIRVKQTAVKA
jgi:hypothetical protein